MSEPTLTDSAKHEAGSQYSANSSPSQPSQHSDGMQKRIRLLSWSGIVAGGFVLCLATGLLAWHDNSRRGAAAISNELAECRLTVSRAMIDIVHEWSTLLASDHVSYAADPTIQDIDEAKWPQELQRASSVCRRLNSHQLLVESGKEISVNAQPLLQWHRDVRSWFDERKQIKSQIAEQSQQISEVLDWLLNEVELQQGQNKLDLAIRLRSVDEQLSTNELANILRAFSGESTAAQLHGDIDRLKLLLTELDHKFVSSSLADLFENRIRPLLLRLHTGAEEFGHSGTVIEIEERLFATYPTNGSAQRELAGLYALNSHLATSDAVRTELIEAMNQQTRILDQQRNEMAIAHTAIMEKLSRQFSNALRYVWLTICGACLLWGLTFAFLTSHVSRDIASQVAALDASANALASEQLLLASVISSLPNPLYWKDNLGRYVGCNRAFAQWLGLDSVAQIIGMTDASLPWTAESARKMQSLESVVLQSGTAVLHADMLLQTVSGLKLDALVSKTPLRDINGEINGLLGTYIDIAERKQMEERSKGLAKIMAECPTEIFVFEPDTYRLLEINRAACKSVGLNSNNCRARTFLEINEELNHLKLSELLRPLYNQKREQLEYETVHRRSDGTVIPVHVSVLMISYEGKNVCVACATELTEYKKLERQLVQAQKLESIGQLSTGIAHEINTPMQCICGNIEFLQTSSIRLMSVVDALQEQLLAPPTDWESRVQELKRFMEQNRYDYVRREIPAAIEESSKAAQKIVEIVRAMKVMSHPGTKEKASTDLNSLIRDAATVSRNRWKYAATIEYLFSEDIPRIDCFPAELSQVFLNLIVNSADAITEKLGENTDKTGVISLRTFCNSERVFVEIEDNGNGIPESIKQRVFEPFFTTKGVGKGTGQGLSITYDVIVKMHHGTIDIESEEGVGTKFTLSMPISRNHPSKLPMDELSGTTTNIQQPLPSV